MEELRCLAINAGGTPAQKVVSGPSNGSEAHLDTSSMKTGEELAHGARLPTGVTLEWNDFSFRDDSNNAQAKKHLCQLAEIIEANYDKYDFMVIVFGTDKMEELAAYLFVRYGISLQKLIILVGAQKSVEELGSEFVSQLESACLAGSVLARLEEPVVGVVNCCQGQIWAGCRLVKKDPLLPDAFHTPGRRAIWVIGAPEDSISRDARRKDPKITMLKPQKECDFDGIYDLKVSADRSPQSFMEAVDRREFTGVLLPVSGLGCIPNILYSQVFRYSWVDAIAKAVEAGIPVIAYSPYVAGSIMLERYPSGRELLKVGVGSAGSLTYAVARARLAFALGKYPLHSRRVKRRTMKRRIRKIYKYILRQVHSEFVEDQAA